MLLGGVDVGVRGHRVHRLVSRQTTTLLCTSAWRRERGRRGGVDRVAVLLHLQRKKEQTDEG